uniref:Mcl1_mid domain-containing protein n=1 Tax=Steinernema glaseri TaxID=37863 RepID=A0A1I8AC25_9BILA
MPNGDGYFSSISMRGNILMAHSSKGWFSGMDKNNLRRIIMMDYAGGVMALGSGSGEVLFYFADRHSYDEFF